MLRVGKTRRGGLHRAFTTLPSPTANFNFLSGALDPRITFTRASSATYIDSAGTLQTAATNVPRFDYDPVTLQPKGLLIEEARTNLLLNSTTLSTQSVTVTAVTHTLSFYGTGTITLSGVSTAGPLVGTGAFPNRVSLTFTPTAGSLTLTVTGSVTSAQLEVGAHASSYIPTAGVTATRAADLANITPANLVGIVNITEGALIASFMPALASPSGFPTVAALQTAAGAASQISIFYFPTATVAANIKLAGVDQFLAQKSVPVGTICTAGIAYKGNDSASSFDGGAPSQDNTVSLPAVDRMTIGNTGGTGFLNGWIRKVAYYNRRPSNAELQALTV